ncbi:MAG: hypothetical protein HQK88_08375 [Nitrospirae bacterium]|nr:hypothetical protein [Nitrospirota bacterium]MBF0534902.1 hypothetical protein [Nitrospirota bacterium]MBF0616817.1 hypothetical protein [Nitrospirota bacterium]
MKDENADRKEDYRRHALYAGIIFAVSVIIYIPTFKSGLIWDDEEIIKGAILVNKKNPYDIFINTGLYCRPMTILSLSLDYTLWHINAIGYHVHNVIIHALNSVLLYIGTFNALKNRSGFNGNYLGISFFSALLFALHPIHTESVAWISDRTDLLATFFFLFAFIALLVYLHEKKREGLFLISVFFLFAILSKENAIVFIVIALAYMFVIRAGKKSFIMVCASVAISLTFYMCLRGFGWLMELFKAPGTSGAFLSKNASSYSAVKNIISAASYYYEKLLCPWNLNIIPELPSGTGYYVLFMIPVILLVFLAVKRNGVGASPRFFAGFWLLWIMITLLPSLTIAVSQIAAPIGERYLYLPSAGFCVLLVMVLYPAHKNSAEGGVNRKLRLSLLFVIALTYALLTHDRLLDWHSDFALWQDAAKKNPHSVITKTNYGIALIREHNFAEAGKQLTEALSFKQLSREKKSIVLNSLGLVEMDKKNYERAESLFIDSLKENSGNLGSYNNLGYLYMKTASQISNDPARKEQLTRRAIEVFKESLKYATEIKEINFNLGLCYLELNDFKNSNAYFDAVIEKDPNSELAQKSINFKLYMEMRKRNMDNKNSPHP